MNENITPVERGFWLKILCRINYITCTLDILESEKVKMFWLKKDEDTHLKKTLLNTNIIIISYNKFFFDFPYLFSYFCLQNSFLVVYFIYLSSCWNVNLSIKIKIHWTRNQHSKQTTYSSVLWLEHNKKIFK